MEVATPVTTLALGLATTMISASDPSMIAWLNPAGDEESRIHLVLLHCIVERRPIPIEGNPYQTLLFQLRHSPRKPLRDGAPRICVGQPEFKEHRFIGSEEVPKGQAQCGGDHQGGDQPEDDDGPVPNLLAKVL